MFIIILKRILGQNKNVHILDQKHILKQKEDVHILK